MYELIPFENIKYLEDEELIELPNFYYKYKSDSITKKDIIYRNTQIKKIINQMKHCKDSENNYIIELLKYAYVIPTKEI